MRTLLLVALCALSMMRNAAAQPLERVATIPLANVKGRIDHLAVDVKGKRLFVAALGNDTVEVLDVAANRHLQSLAGFGEPQGIAYLSESNRLFVAARCRPSSASTGSTTPTTCAMTAARAPSSSATAKARCVS